MTGLRNAFLPSTVAAMVQGLSSARRAGVNVSVATVEPECAADVAMSMPLASDRMAAD